MRVGLAEVDCRLLQPIVRHLREHVVHLVRADVMDHAVYDAVVAVDAAQLAAHKVPVVVGEPRHGHLGVMEERDDDAVGRKDKERHEVVAEEGEDSVGLDVGVEEARHRRNADERTDAAERVPVEKGARQREVTHVARRVPLEEIPEPPDSQSEPGQGLAADAGCRLANGVEDLVLLKVVGVLVVTFVRQLPHVERAHEEAVVYGADDVVQQVTVGERVVSAVVSDHEHRREERALDGPVQEHRHGLERRRLNLHQLYGHGVRDHYKHGVSQRVVHRRRYLRLEAALG